MPKKNPDLVTVAEAARMCEVSIVTVHRWIKAGELTPVMQLPGSTGAYLLSRVDVLTIRAERWAVSG